VWYTSGMNDLLATIISHIEYDFAEDSDEVQGNWDITMVDDQLTVNYLPFDDSPHPAATMTYQITRTS
jgi:hypothetical protein